VAERLTIARMGHRGDGIAEGPQGQFYIAGALPGEMVDVEVMPGHPDRRLLVAIQTPSSERIAPICPHFGVCGGCAVQHWRDERYRAWKRELVVMALHQVGIVAPVSTIIDAHGDGRRRAVFHARRLGHDVLKVGFSAARGHKIVAIDRCPILARSLDGALRAAWAIADPLATPQRPLDIQATATETGLDIDVRGSGPIKPAEAEKLARVAAAHGLARLTRHGELIAQARLPLLRIGRATVPLPPAAFLQATAAGEAELARLVLQACSGATAVADLFSGVGLFALRLAEHARVLAADKNTAAVAALETGARKAVGLKPIQTMCRDLFENPLTASEARAFDAVIFNPPRQGALAQSRELAASGVPVVVAVSCNPATFARDMRILADGGYRLAAVTPVDQFRYSPHVEIVARLEK